MTPTVTLISCLSVGSSEEQLVLLIDESSLQLLGLLFHHQELYSWDAGWLWFHFPLMRGCCWRLKVVLCLLCRGVPTYTQFGHGCGICGTIVDLPIKGMCRLYCPRMKCQHGNSVSRVSCELSDVNRDGNVIIFHSGSPAPLKPLAFWAFNFLLFLTYF